MTIPILESWAWPWPIATLHAAYLLSGLLIAVHYVPQLRRAWRFPAETRAAQSLATWTVWTICRAVAFTYGVFVLHDLVFLLVVGADLCGRFAIVALIVRAHAMPAAGARAERRPRPSHRTAPGKRIEGQRSATGPTEATAQKAWLAARKLVP